MTFLALWNDLRRGREAEYEAWHTREHVPERVAAPGFRSGRRYRRDDHPAHRWFTLYEVDGLEAFDTPEYHDLLANPTPWSASMRPDFRNFLRVPCVTTGAEGFGIGAALAVLRLKEEAAVPALADGVVRARLGRRAVASDFRAGAGGSGADDDFAAVLLIETLDRATAERAFAEAAARFAPGAAPLDLGGVYDLLFVFPGADADERTTHRRPHWPITPRPPSPSRG
ncbi:hypothetical protein [Falsiroseomonas sp. HW251]|uniref:hypothetical protein n=1 Tax=Falsiroseomonas sp. HW251 TaxID=3390998 RepID=UPI003D31EB97